jgi:hypothetical protein
MNNRLDPANYTDKVFRKAILGKDAPDETEAAFTDAQVQDATLKVLSRYADEPEFLQRVAFALVRTFHLAHA